MTKQRYGIGSLEEEIRNMVSKIENGDSFTTEALNESANWTAPVKVDKLAKALDLNSTQRNILLDYFTSQGKISATTKVKR